MLGYILPKALLRFIGITQIAVANASANIADWALTVTAFTKFALLLVLVSKR